jgi:hypothetical protein
MVTVKFYELMAQINLTWRFVSRDSITEDQSKAFLKGLQEEGFEKTWSQA